MQCGPALANAELTLLIPHLLKHSAPSAADPERLLRSILTQQHDLPRQEDNDYDSIQEQPRSNGKSTAHTSGHRTSHAALPVALTDIMRFVSDHTKVLLLYTY